MRSLFNLSLLTSVAALMLASVAKATVIEPIVFLLLVMLAFFARKDENSLLLTIIFAAVFALEVSVAFGLKYIVFPAVESFYYENIYAFSIQLLLSLLLLILLRHRMTIAVILTRGKSASVFEKNYAEGPLYFLVITSVLIDFLALMENFLRNLEHLGVDEEKAKVFWEITFFYDYFEYLKTITMLLCVLLLYIGLIVRTKREPIKN